MSLPIYSQHLLVLLFGTFRVIHSNSQRANTGMTAEALGVSVAPSFFHTCVAEGKVAMPDDVLKFKVGFSLAYSLYWCFIHNLHLYMSSVLFF